MIMLPRSIYLMYPDNVKAANEAAQLPERLHLRGCKVLEASRNKQGLVERVLVSSEYDAIHTIVLELKMVGENVAVVQDVDFKETV